MKNVIEKSIAMDKFNTIKVYLTHEKLKVSEGKLLQSEELILEKNAYQS